MKAIIFDVDGTLVDTEKDGHLPACNATFAKMGLDIYWDWPTFIQLQTIAGNAPRLTMWLNKHFNMTEGEIKKTVDEFSALKPSIYINEFLPALTLRPGILSFMEEAIQAGQRLAIVTNSLEGQVHALINRHLSAYADKFEYVLGRESGPKTPKGGRLYEDCLERMNLQPHEAIAIEDSGSGCASALRAKMPCAVFYNEYTYGHGFAGAQLVAPSIEYFNLAQVIEICSTPPIKTIASTSKPELAA